MSRLQRRPTGGTSLDLLVVSSLAVLGLALLAFPVGPGLRVLRVPVGSLLVLFLPGYALVSALLPSAGGVGSCHPPPDQTDGDDTAETDAASPDREAETGADGTAHGVIDDVVVTGPMRVVLALGVSAGAGPLVGIVLGHTPFGLAPFPTLAALTGLTVVLSVVAAVRRRRTPNRFGVSVRRGTRRFRSTVVADADRETVLNLLLVAGMVVAVAGLGLAAATADNGEQYTEFYLLTEDPDTGTLVADGYPESVRAGEPIELHVGVANREAGDTTYTLVVLLQRLEGPPEARTVVEQARLDRQELTVRQGRTTEFRHAAEPTLRGENLRLTYLLYRGPPPDTPGTGTAYRSLHIWIDVEPPAS